MAGGVRAHGREHGETTSTTPCSGSLAHLVSSQPQRANRMMERLNAYLAGLPPPGPAGPEQSVDEETSEALESLGYF